MPLVMRGRRRCSSRARRCRSASRSGSRPVARARSAACSAARQIPVGLDSSSTNIASDHGVGNTRRSIADHLRQVGVGERADLAPAARGSSPGAASVPGRSRSGLGRSGARARAPRRAGAGSRAATASQRDRTRPRSAELADRGAARAVQRRVLRRDLDAGRLELGAIAHRPVADGQPAAPRARRAARARDDAPSYAVGRERRAARRELRARPVVAARRRPRTPRRGARRSRRAAATARRLAGAAGRSRRRKRAQARDADELGAERLREAARGRDPDAQAREVPGPTPTAIRSSALQPMPARAEQLAGHREQARGVARVRARPAGRRARCERRCRRPAQRRPRSRGSRCRSRARSLAPRPPRSVGDRRPRCASVTRKRAPASSALGVRRPLDERDPARAEVVGEQVRVLLLEARQAVEVEVRDRELVAGAVAVADAEASGS